MNRPGPWQRAAKGLREAKRALRQLFGVPDYERYVEHMRCRHPDAPRMSEPEFHATAIDRRYGASRPKCC